MAGNKTLARSKNKEEKESTQNKKIIKKKNSSTENSPESSQKDTPDLSVIRNSTVTSVTGTRQLQKLLESATEEVKDLLNNESEIIFECRFCRNLFRSILNFISHKRIYCKQKFNISLHAHFRENTFMNDDFTTIYESDDKSDVCKDSCLEKNINNKKDLGSIIDKLSKDKFSKNKSLLEYYDDINFELAQKEIQRKENAIRLDHIATTKSAVYQTVVKQGDKDTNDEFMLDEIIELHDMLWNEESVLGPDGRLLSVGSENKFKDCDAESSNDIGTEDERHVCKICNMEFKTKSTLLWHIKIKHCPSHIHYACPSCSATFPTAGSVYRHLCNEHRNTMVTIRKLRDQILCNGFRLDDAPKIIEKKQQKISKTDQQIRDEQNQEWMDNFEGYGGGQRCGGCGKTFDRRAALTSHQLICRKRLAEMNKMASNKRVETNVDSNDLHNKRLVDDADLKRNRKQKPVKRFKKPDEEDVNKCDMAELIGKKGAEVNENMGHRNVDESLERTVSKMNENVSTNIRKDSVSQSDEVDGEGCDNDKLSSTKNSSHDNSENESMSNNFKKSVRVNKRKRKQTTKIIDNNDTYWDMDEDGSLEVKKVKLETTDKADSITEQLTKKMYSLMNIQNLQCLSCRKRFPTLTNLKRHTALHMKWKRYQCALCTSQFYHKSECVFHIGRCHNLMGDKKFVDTLVMSIQPNESTNYAKNNVSISENDNISMLKNNKSEETLESNSGNIETMEPNIIDKDIEKSNVDMSIETVVTNYTSEQEEIEPQNSNTNNIVDNVADDKKTVTDSISESENKEEIKDGLLPPRKRGRPRSNTNILIPLSDNEDDIGHVNETDDSQQIRRRGRPKGSLNKDKKKKNHKGSPPKNEKEDNEVQQIDKKSEDSLQIDETEGEMRKMIFKVIFGGEENAKKHSMITDTVSNPLSTFSDKPPLVDVIAIKESKPVLEVADILAPPPVSELIEERPVPDLSEVRSSRPIRNRVKPIKKDFVYDLSDLLKKEAEAYKESQMIYTYSKTTKKRTRSVTPADSCSMNKLDDTNSNNDSEIFCDNDQIKNTSPSETVKNNQHKTDYDISVLHSDIGTLPIESTMEDGTCYLMKDPPTISPRNNETVTVIPVHIPDHAPSEDSDCSDEEMVIDTELEMNKSKNSLEDYSDNNSTFNDKDNVIDENFKCNDINSVSSSNCKTKPFIDLQSNEDINSRLSFENNDYVEGNLSKSNINNDHCFSEEIPIVVNGHTNSNVQNIKENCIRNFNFSDRNVEISCESEDSDIY